MLAVPSSRAGPAGQAEQEPDIKPVTSLLLAPGRWHTDASSTAGGTAR